MSSGEFQQTLLLCASEFSSVEISSDQSCESRRRKYAIARDLSIILIVIGTRKLDDDDGIFHDNSRFPIPLLY